MTRDDVIRLAQKAGFKILVEPEIECIDRLIKLAQSEERKEILNEIITKYLKCDCGLLTPKENKCVKLIVKRIDTDIRARNKKL